MYTCVKNDSIDGRWSDNYMGSKDCSWETSLSLSEEMKAVYPVYLFFICRWKLKSSGAPVEVLTGDEPPWGLLSLAFPYFFPPAHFPSPTLLICTRELPCLSGRWGRRRSSITLPFFFLPHSQTLFILHCCGLQSKPSPDLLRAPPRLALLRGKRRFSSQPSSLTAFPSHTSH